MAQITRVLLRLLMAALLGGVLGYERETTARPPALRTHMLVAMGAAMFVLVPQLTGAAIDDMSRVIQGVVAGIGFLCAGAIIKNGTERGCARPDHGGQHLDDRRHRHRLRAWGAR